MATVRERDNLLYKTSHLRPIAADTPPPAAAQTTRARAPSFAGGSVLAVPLFLVLPGPLLCFHAVSLGEGMAAVAVIKLCVQRSPKVTILMATTVVSTFEVIRNQLPSCVIYKFAPVDTPAAMDAFLGYWKPSAILLMESEIWPNLIVGASKNDL